MFDQPQVDPPQQSEHVHLCVRCGYEVPCADDLRCARCPADPHAEFADSLVDLLTAWGLGYNLDLTGSDSDWRLQVRQGKEALTVELWALWRLERARAREETQALRQLARTVGLNAAFSERSQDYLDPDATRPDDVLVTGRGFGLGAEESALALFRGVQETMLLVLATLEAASDWRAGEGSLASLVEDLGRMRPVLERYLRLHTPMLPSEFRQRECSGCLNLLPGPTGEHCTFYGDNPMYGWSHDAGRLLPVYEFALDELSRTTVRAALCAAFLPWPASLLASTMLEAGPSGFTLQYARSVLAPHLAAGGVTPEQLDEHYSLAEAVLGLTPSAQALLWRLLLQERPRRCLGRIDRDRAVASLADWARGEEALAPALAPLLSTLLYQAALAWGFWPGQLAELTGQDVQARKVHSLEELGRVSITLPNLAHWLATPDDEGGGGDDGRDDDTTPETPAPRPQRSLA